MVACAVALDDEIGVDVEYVDRSVPVEIADHYFAPPEVKAIHAEEISRRAARFLDYWTLKESYIKARGLGLTIPLDRFWIELDDARPRLVVARDLGDDGEAWQLAQHRPTDQHVLALCVRRRQPHIDRIVVWKQYPQSVRIPNN